MVHRIAAIPGIIVIIIVILIMNNYSIATMTAIIAAVVMIMVMMVHTDCHDCKSGMIRRIESIIVWRNIGYINR
jgi:uncharacterized membrane protein